MIDEVVEGLYTKLTLARLEEKKFLIRQDIKPGNVNKAIGELRSAKYRVKEAQKSLLDICSAISYFSLISSQNQKCKDYLKEKS